MLNVTRYVNGNKVSKADLGNFVMDNEVMLKTMKIVNERLNGSFHQDTLVEKVVENAPEICYDGAGAQDKGGVL